MGIFDTTAGIGGSILDPIAAKIKRPFSTTVPNNGERGQDFPTGFQIQEYVEGEPLLGSENFVQLLGNMMPMQPFPWSTEQRTTVDYYPGNPEPVVQLLGAKKGPVTVHGRFKDKHFKDPSYYGAAYQFAQLLENMCERGNLLRFGMAGQNGKWIRWGFLDKVDFKMNKLSWIDYELTFTVVSDKQPINNYFAAPEKSAPSAINANLINAVTDFQANYSTVPSSVPVSIADVLNGLISGVAKNINLVTNFVDSIASTAADLDASAFRALGLVKNAKAYMSKLRRNIDFMRHDFHTITHSGNPIQQVKDTYHNLRYLHNTISSSVTISQWLAQLQAQFEAIAKTVPIARYRVKAGDTLQNISTQFYGKPDNWDKIYDHNKLHTTDLDNASWPSKPILEIPHL